MRFLYTLFIYVFTGLMHLAALLHAKAGLWVKGRKQWRIRYPQAFHKTGPVLWVHAASLGEFEQGRPVMEAFRERFPGWQVVLSFFSPSGYEIRKNYPFADAVLYMPADTPRNARDFIDLIQPDAVIFVKYEFWGNHLFELKRRGIPTLLVSALFRAEQPFFKWYGGFWRQMLGCFSHFFVQNPASATLLQSTGFSNYTLAGDTRVDRVLKIAEQAAPNDIAAAFSADAPGPRLIAGSSWPADEAVLLPLIQDAGFRHWKFVLAPHEPSKPHLAQLIPQLSVPAVRYSECLAGAPADGRRVLIIDNIGLLNTLYRYGTVAWIGGGFGKGIHNTLEPAAFGLPIIFGPRYEKFEEARQFVARGGAFVVRTTADLTAILRRLEEPEFYRTASDAVRGYLAENRGATELVLQYLSGSGK